MMRRCPLLSSAIKNPMTGLRTVYPTQAKNGLEWGTRLHLCALRRKFCIAIGASTA